MTDMYTNNKKSWTLSRRVFLKSVAVGGVSTLAGCLRVGQSGPSEETPTQSKGPSQTSTMTEQEYQTRTFRSTPSENPGHLVYREGAGPVNVEVFSDYAHDECQQFWNHTKYTLRDYYTSDVDTGEGPDISFVLRHFPKPVNKWSMFLPCAMMEVRDQKDILKQGEFHERLFENHYPDYSIRDVEIAANMVGADPEEVVKAGKERRRSYAIKWDLEDGEDYELEEPLRVVVDGEPVEENTGEAIEQAIERAL